MSNVKCFEYKSLYSFLENASVGGIFHFTFFILHSAIIQHLSYNIQNNPVTASWLY
jgi:hypothetical protein